MSKIEEYSLDFLEDNIKNKLDKLEAAKRKTKTLSTNFAYFEILLAFRLDILNPKYDLIEFLLL